MTHDKSYNLSQYIGVKIFSLEPTLDDLQTYWDRDLLASKLN